MKWSECEICGEFVCLDCGECPACDEHTPDCPQGQADLDADMEWREYISGEPE